MLAIMSVFHAHFQVVYLSCCLFHLGTGEKFSQKFDSGLIRFSVATNLFNLNFNKTAGCYQHIFPLPLFRNVSSMKRNTLIYAFLALLKQNCYFFQFDFFSVFCSKNPKIWSKKAFYIKFATFPQFLQNKRNFSINNFFH